MRTLHVCLWLRLLKNSVVGNPENRDDTVVNNLKLKSPFLILIMVLHTESNFIGKQAVLMNVRAHTYSIQIGDILHRTIPPALRAKSL